MNILFISANGIEDLDFGGPKGSIRNYKALQGLGNVDVYTIKKESKLKSAISLLCGLYPPISKKNIRELRQMARHHYDIVFFDGSIYGKIINIFDDSKRVVFYHNCEHDFILVRFGHGISIKKYVYQTLVDRNERIMTLKSDYRITFSNRDADRIKELYNSRIDAVAPLGIDDKYTGIRLDNVEDCCLLLGPVCAANLEGYRWFAINVSPYLSCKTVIAGKGFEDFKDELESDKVEVVGYVLDLEKRYANSLCVAIPIFSGAGMKVKTVEALMFGKTVFATDEALAGFESDMDGCAYTCNTAEEFVRKINKFVESSQCEFNNRSRKLYEEKYSVQSSRKIFEKMIIDMGLEEII